MSDLSADEIVYRRRAEVDLEALDALYGSAWPNHSKGTTDGAEFAHSFTWITAHAGDDLVGFVNVAWDGGVHFFLLDTTVHASWQHRGVGTRLVQEAIAVCREYGKGHHLHVDSSEELMRDFYIPAGFHWTNAGTVWVGPDRVD